MATTSPRSAPGGARPALLVALLCVAVVSLGCARESPQTELADDPADVTVPGPAPTAPTTDPSEGLTADGNALLGQLEALQSEDDLCEVLSGEAFGDLVDAEANPAGLVSSPSGVTRLVTLLDASFAHLVAISPPEVAPSMQTIRDVWTRVATLGVSPQDAQMRTAEILAEPEVVAATQNLGGWAALNCPGMAADALGPG